MALAVVAILGIAMVAFARSSRAPAVPPRVGDDHWHSAYAFYDCDQFLPSFVSASDPDGIHSHQDGVIHIHPWNSSASGDDARLKVFFESMGARVTDDEISGPGIGVLKAGSDCNGEPTVIRAARFTRIDASALPEGEEAPSTLSELYVLSEEFDDDFGDIRLETDLEAFTLARVPANAEIPPPPEDRLEIAVASSRGNLLSEGPETEIDPSDAPVESEG